MRRHIVVAMTGASGVVYGLRLCQELLAGGMRLTLLISGAGFQVLSAECGLDWNGSEAELQQKLREHFQAGADNLSFYGQDNFQAPVASGSNAPDAMVVCPCSMGTLARITAGTSGNLLERCADVVLKERRILVLAPRETPLNAIHLENMLKLARLGVVIVPPMPGFYHKPATIEDLVNYIVGKILDSLRVDHDLFRRWDMAGD